MRTNTQNNKGFTLIELIIVTMILGILAAVAIPRYTATVTKAEEAVENAVISSIRAGLETYATEMLMENGRKSWPSNPFDALETDPDLYDRNDVDNYPDQDGEWTFGDDIYYGNKTINHQRGNNTVTTWSYNKGVQDGYNAEVGNIGGTIDGHNSWNRVATGS
jgi:prepilin-type N-terminal cleavage/methylation domain-containing protein